MFSILGSLGAAEVLPGDTWAACQKGKKPAAGNGRVVGPTASFLGLYSDRAEFIGVDEIYRLGPPYPVVGW